MRQSRTCLSSAHELQCEGKIERLKQEAPLARVVLTIQPGRTPLGLLYQPWAITILGAAPARTGGAKYMRTSLFALFMEIHKSSWQFRSKITVSRKTVK
jgi:hypothetical protein